MALNLESHPMDYSISPSHCHVFVCHPVDYSVLPVPLNVRKSRLKIQLCFRIRRAFGIRFRFYPRLEELPSKDASLHVEWVPSFIEITYRFSDQEETSADRDDEDGSSINPSIFVFISPVLISSHVCPSSVYSRTPLDTRSWRPRRVTRQRSLRRRLELSWRPAVSTLTCIVLDTPRHVFPPHFLYRSQRRSRNVISMRSMIETFASDHVSKFFDSKSHF